MTLTRQDKRNRKETLIFWTVAVIICVAALFAFVAAVDYLTRDFNTLIIHNKNLQKMNTTFKTGDFIFYRDKHGALQSTKVWTVTKKRLLVENWNTEDDEFGNAAPVAKYVSPDRCQLQTEWNKENK